MIWQARTNSYLRLVSANDRIHSRNSGHYRDKALDFQGENLESLAEWFRSFGFLVYWQVPGHYQHVHVEYMGPLVQPVISVEEKFSWALLSVPMMPQ